MNKIRATILVPFVLAAIAPVLADAQTVGRATQAAAGHPAKKAVIVKKASKPAAGKKVACRYQVRHGKKVRVCK